MPYINRDRRGKAIFSPENLETYTGAIKGYMETYNQ